MELIGSFFELLLEFFGFAGGREAANKRLKLLEAFALAFAFRLKEKIREVISLFAVNIRQDRRDCRGVIVITEDAERLITKVTEPLSKTRARHRVHVIDVLSNKSRQAKTELINRVELYFFSASSS